MAHTKTLKSTTRPVKRFLASAYPPMAAATQVSSMLMTHMNTVLNIQMPAGRSNRRV